MAGRRTRATPEGPADLDLGTDKLYFKIGEAARIVGVATHVLRYWETEIATVRPTKSRGQQRVYRRSDLKLLLRIKRLVHDEGLTLAGARRKLGLAGGREEPAPATATYRAHATLARVRAALVDLRAYIDAGPGPADPVAQLHAQLPTEAPTEAQSDRPRR